MIIESPPQPKKRIHSMPEGKIQASCYQYFWNNYPQYRGLYFAVPNENTRADSNAITGAIRRSMGVYHGVADTLLLIPRGRFHGLCIEYKDENGKWVAKVLKPIENEEKFREDGLTASPVLEGPQV